MPTVGEVEPLTEEGKVVGTVAYMSPEQAEGKPVDHRTDIFSLGIILYEMATGERPFKGDTNLSIMSSIARDTPTSVTELNRSLPRHLGRIIKRALTKDAEHRLQTAKDLRNELEELKEEVESGEAVPVGAVASAGRRTRWPGYLTMVTIVVFLGFILWQAGVFERGTGRAPIVQSTAHLTSLPGRETYPSLSPDGDEIIYASDMGGDLDIYWQKVAGGRVLNLTEDSPADDYQPAFSPDGQSIAFRSDRDGGGIYVMSGMGENVRRLTDGGYNPAWSPVGNEITFSEQNIGDPTLVQGGRVSIVAVATGERRLMGEGYQPHWSPNGHRIAYFHINPRAERDIWTVSANGGEPVAVTADAALDWNPVWSANGQHLYFSSDRGGSFDVWRILIDEVSGEVLGDPEPVTTGEAMLRGYITVSLDGRRLAYSSQAQWSNLMRAAFDPSSETIVGQAEWITRGSRQVGSFDLSPDGEWIAFVNVEPREDLFKTRKDGTEESQLTDDEYRVIGPTWAPDGTRIAFYTNRSDLIHIWSVNPDGSAILQLTSSSGPGRPHWHPVWSPDGRRLAYTDHGQSPATVLIVDLNAPLEDQDAYPLPPIDPIRPLAEQAVEALPPFNEAGDLFLARSWSPDGEWLAGERRLGIAPTGDLVLFSLALGEYVPMIETNQDHVFPAWLSDSRRVLFGAGGKIVMIDRESLETKEVLSVQPDRIMQVQISRDDRTIYFVRQTVEADIWLLTLEQ